MKRETLPVFRARRETVAYEDRHLLTKADECPVISERDDATMTLRNVTVTSRWSDHDEYEEYSLALDDGPTEVHGSVECVPVTIARANDHTLIVGFDLGPSNERIVVFGGDPGEIAALECFMGDVKLALAKGALGLSSSRRSGR